MTGKGPKTKPPKVKPGFSDRSELIDGDLSQDENSAQYQDDIQANENLSISTKSSPIRKPNDSEKPGQSTNSDVKDSSHSVPDKRVVTVNMNVNKIFTETFIFQILILIGICILWTVMFTSYINYTQKTYLKENLDGILHVTQSGQKMIDTTTNDEMSIRVPVLISNSTPTIIDSLVTEWIDKYIVEKLPGMVSSHFRSKYSVLEEKCNSEVEKLTDHLVWQAEDEIYKNVTAKLKPKIDETINANLGSMVEDQVKVQLDGTVQAKVKAYVDSQIPVKGPKAVEDAVDTDEVKEMLQDALKTTINTHVLEKSPDLIQERTSDDKILKDTDDKIATMVEQRLRKIDMTDKVSEVFVENKLSEEIRKRSETLVQKEYVGQIDSKVKAKVEEIVDSHKVQVGKFNDDADSKIKVMEEFMDQMESFIKTKKTELGILNIDSIHSRQERLMIISMVEDQVKVQLDGTVQNKVKAYVDSQIPVKGPKAVADAVDTEEVKEMLQDALKTTINRHVLEKSPDLIQERTNDTRILKDMDDKIATMVEQRLGKINMTDKVSEVFVENKLSEEIRKRSETLVQKEYVGQIDSKVKAKIEEIVDSHKVQVGKFNDDADSKIQVMEEFMNQMESFIKTKKSDFGIMNIDSILSRQEYQASYLWFLTVIVFVLIFCVYWLCFIRNNKSVNVTQARSCSPPAGPSNQRGVMNVNQPHGTSDTCVILFNKSHMEDVRALIDGLNIPNFTYHFLVINDKRGIDGIPKYKTYLMVVEFNEKHVIIELPGVGLGDMKKNTHDRIRTLGGQLILLYMRDPGSRDLKDRRYNEQISRIKQQEELKQLTQDGCFFSIYKTLTPVQCKTLREKLTQR